MILEQIYSAKPSSHFLLHKHPISSCKRIKNNDKDI